MYALVFLGLWGIALICASRAALAVALLALYPNVAESRRTARQFSGPSDEWIATLRWMREHIQSGT